MRRRKLEEKLPFELANLDLIYNDMVACMEEDTDKNKDVLVERIRQMTEFQLWGERNNEAFFDFFCEKNVLEMMLKLLKTSTAREITIQIIQSLSMYLTNIRKPVNINYVLSNNSINEFIAHNFNFEDDETVDYYISFLKSLSLRLEVIPLELFYNEKYKNFPLMAQAVRFYNYPASMVRTSVQNITLTLFRLDDKKLQHYFSNFPFANYFVNVSCYLRDIWLKIDEALPESTIQSASKLRELLDDQYDLLMYLEDIFQLQNKDMNTILANALISYTIIPTLIVPFTSSKKGVISLNLSLYLINLLFNSITYTPIIEFLFITLFSSKITPALLEQCLAVPKEPLSYSKHWSFVNNWDLHEKTLGERYLALLERIEEKNGSPTITRSTSADKVEEGANGQQEETAGPQINVNIEEEDKALTKALGVVTDFSKPELEDLTKLAFINLLEELKNSFTNTGDEVSGAELSANPISEAFLSFFMSKDDNMILLLTNILNSVLNHKLIQPKLFGACNLNYEKNDILSQLNNENAEEQQQQQQNPKNQTALYVLDCLYKLFIVDPPFRVITMRLITKLILQLSQHKKEKVMMSAENLRNFNIGYTNSINKVIKFVQNSITADFFVELFDVQWKSLYKKDFVKMDKKDFFYMLLPLIEEPIPGIDPYLRLPAGEYELAKREISIFLLFRKIRYALIKTTKYSPQFIEDYGAGLRKENPSNYWEDGKYYSIEQKKLIPCTLKDEANKGTSCYIAEDDENFSVIKFDPNRIHWAQVLINIRLKYAEAIVDRTEPNTLIVTMKIKDKYVDKKLSFTERTLCQTAKRTLEDNRRYAKHYEVSVLVKNFEQAKNDIYE